MGRMKKKFNWKARQVVSTSIDRSEEKKIHLDIGNEHGAYDDCNALVLPTHKRKTKVHKPLTVSTKILSKKERKRLEQIVKRKQQKEKRAELLEELSKVQASEEELSQLKSIAHVQTCGLKKKWMDNGLEGSGVSLLPKEGDGEEVNVVKGSRKRRRMLAVMDFLDKKPKTHDPSIVGLDDTSDDEISLDSDVELKENVYNETQPENDFEQIGNKESEESLDLVNQSQPMMCENNKSTEKILTVKKIQTNGNTVLVSDMEANAKSREAGVPKGWMVELLPLPQQKDSPVEKKKAAYVLVNRNPEIQAARLQLPILAEEQVIMEAIYENQVVILAGETGSGKTTQVPQFLYEAGYTRNGKMIGVTEPRRVAAISMAKRVGEELSLGPEKVSYLIRFEGNVSPDTEIKFMTDGVLLKELQTDFMLTKYSVIILDEAHERSVYTDILMGLLSRIVPLRCKRNDPLKLIIMSATLRLKDFTENKSLFKITPPVISVESRQFPVTIHFNKRTNCDYLREAFKKTCRIHTQLPDGGILIFVTGQKEVKTLVSKLKKAFPIKNRPIITKKGECDDEGDVESAEVDLNLDHAIRRVKKQRKEMHLNLPEIDLDNYELTPGDDTEGDMLGMESEDEEEDWSEERALAPLGSQPLWVLPLYSILPSWKQAKVFEPPPEGMRLCVVATNVAETSLTIPGVKYVVDTGKVKTKLYDKVTGVTAFQVVWASKAAANQRAGRAGRTAPGHCYRLYSSAVFNNDFEEWSMPEMQKRNVDDLILQMKSLGIERVVNFPFPSPPDETQLKIAEKRLTLLGALTSPPKGKNTDWSGKLTFLGESMAKFPVAPRYAKMLCLSHQHGLLEYTVSIVAALSVQELLLSGEGGQKFPRAKWVGVGNSLLLGDAMILLKAIGAAEYANHNGKLVEFCTVHGVRQKAVIEARKIRLQLTNEINLSNPQIDLCVDPKMEPPSDTQARLLRQVVLAGMVDQVARKCEDEGQPGEKRRPLYNTIEMEEPVQIHNSSCLYREYPEWIVYQEVFETNKMYIRGITAIEPEWLPVFAPASCHLSDPLPEPPPRYDATNGKVYCHVKGTFGRCGWPLPVVELEFPEGLEKYKWFSVFLLDGAVFPKLKEFTKSLLSSPQTMVKSWAKLQVRTEVLLKTLISKQVSSKEQLLDVWETNSRFLLSAYLQWLPESAHPKVEIIWPPI